MSKSNQHIMNYLNKGIRFDGRKLDEYRDIEVETGIIKTAEGSARVKIGDSEVIVGVKMSIEKPYPDTPDKGMLMIGAELLPLSSPDFEVGPPGNWAIEVARVIDRGIRESHVIDVDKLCIEEGEKVWSVLIDICTINEDGNLLDAAGLGVMLSLLDTRFPTYEDGKIDYKTKTDKKLPLNMKTLATTVYKVGDKIFVDPTAVEEKQIDARLTITITESGSLCAFQKGGDIPLSKDDVVNMVALAKEKNSKMVKYLG